MKLTKPVIVIGAIVTLVAGTGVAFAATDTFITKAPANDRPTRVYTQPAVQATSPDPETSSTASPENDTETNTTTPLVNSQTNTIESEPVNEPAPTPAVTPEVVQTPVTNPTNVSNETSNTSVGNNPDASVSHN